MTDAHTQQLAKKCIEQLEELVLLGKLESVHYLGDLRTRLEAIAKPPPPAVTARKPPPVPSTAPKPRAKATWSYAGAEDDELTFQENDQIEIVEEVDAAWWRGAVIRPNGTRTKSGLFPSNYVEKIVTSPPSSIKSASSPPPPARNLPPVYTPSIHSDHTPSTYSFHSPDNDRNMQGYQGQPPMSMPSPYDNSSEKPQRLGPAPWQPGVARWSSGAPIPAPPPPPPPQQQGYGMPPSPAPSNQSYYQQQQQQQQQQQHPPEKMEMNSATMGPSNPALYGTQQPVPPDHAKQDKLKKFGGRMGQTLATSFVGGVGFGVGSHLF